MVWKKVNNDFVSRAGELTLHVKPKPDGRWTWEVTKDGASGAMASGVANSANQAKRNSENFAERAI